MSDSVLGDDLEFERQKIFFRKIGRILLRKDDITRQADRTLRGSLDEQVRRGRGTFRASPKQFGWLCDIEKRLTRAAEMSDEMIDGLVDQGEEIRESGALPSRRMSILVGYAKYSLFTIDVMHA